MTGHHVYRCARCGRRLVRPGITDTAGAGYGPTCAEKVGLIVVRAKRTRKAAGTHRSKRRANQTDLFTGAPA